MNTFTCPSHKILLSIAVGIATLLCTGVAVAEGQRDAKALRRELVESIRASRASATQVPTRIEHRTIQRVAQRNEADRYNPRVWESRRHTGSVTFARQAAQDALIFEELPAEEIIAGPSNAGQIEYTLQGGPGPYASDVEGDCPCFGCRSRGWLAGWGARCDGGCQTNRCASGCIAAPDNVAVFAGIHAFKGPLDDGEGNNFGFQEGFNLAGPVRFSDARNIGYQIGYQATQSQLSGTLTSDNTRNQNFLTVGFFRRQPVGLQWGIVWDWLNDDYREEHNLSQVRIQTSMANHNGSEIGFWTAIGTGDDSYTENGMVSVVETVKPVDQFAFFYRWRLKDCGNARLWAGFTGGGEGLFGGDLTLPMSDRWALQGSFNYLIPKDDNSPIGTQQESWNLGFNVVWYLGCKAKYTECCSRYQPMFDVADNGTFFVD